MSGQEFSLITYRQNWGEDRVYFHDKSGKLTSIPAQWTSMFPQDPWISMPNDNSYFRVPDLLELAHIIKDIGCASDANHCSKNDSDIV